MEIEGDYLAYSFDYNYLYGQGNLNIILYNLKIKGERVRVDFNKNILEVFGKVKVDLIFSSELEKKISKSVQGDQFIFDLEKKQGKITNYRGKIISLFFDSELNKIEPFPIEALIEINLNKIRTSFLYYTFTKMELLENFKIIGYGVLCYLEGIESIYLKKFALKKGSININPGLRINKIWYTSSQGIIGDAELHLFQSDKTYSKTHINYEERSVLKEHFPPDRIFRLQSENKIILTKNSNLNLNANYDSYSNWTASLFYNRQFENLGFVNIDISHIHPIGGFSPETWFKVDSSFSSQEIGNISSSIGYEIQGQFQGAVSYSRNILKKLNLSINASYNTAKETKVLTPAKIFSGDASLSFKHGYFNIIANYSLNSDMINRNSLSIPRLSLSLASVPLYQNLLNIGISNHFYYYISKNKYTGKTVEYSDNLIFELNSTLTSLPFIDNLTLSLRAEEFFRERREGYLSSGIMINVQKELIKNTLSLYGIYSYNTHRKNKKWFIEGTYYQNFLTYLNFTFLEKINGNISLNIDPKMGRVTNTFATFIYKLGRSWYINSNFQYDFLMKKINNLDFYLIRDVKKFDIRFVWRYLTKQIFVEIVPK
ncbi:hypothetical protein NLC82_01130 [Candidatus Aminicenantes bacterium AC-335-A11]|jgi:hypothetical protein|nr:hypothetical protein [SCandidatus Aminicenantes bacterium Aminicenantia_JdfR_composite]MCP2598083.1 hypothetical protein [Candidatus Aminicenantes bacterium AC-335-L06]MCP2606255.1 hypothetical protein [Candidatus Aminicenantes bacterium AC-708-I09]MCP2618007.1 hypothetical protein [Candidatus Aminicenantes bacterium AC-335-A11]MCP2620689.1 hypothetical protein [Candidatus Aminicenantes bacterium AC-334-E05]